MPAIKKEDEKKWINAFGAISGIILGYLTIGLITHLGEWFDLEARVSHFLYVTQGAGIAVGLGSFITILKHKKSFGHLQEVYQELLKVVWPDKDTVLKVTVGIIIGVTIVSGIFVGVDFVFQQALGLIY